MSESEQPLKDDLAKLRVQKLSSEKALPKSGADTLVKIIKGYAVASNGGETQVNYKDVASAAGAAPTVVSSNNSFLLESGILSSPRYGFYVPTENAVRFAREAAWDESGAKAHMRKIVLNCWYGQVVAQNFILRSLLSRDDLKRALAIKSGAGEGDSSALDFLVDFIIYISLAVENENGTLSKGNFDELTKSPVAGQSQEIAQKSNEALLASSPGSQARPNEGAVSFVIHIHVNSFNDLTPERAGRLKTFLRMLDEEHTAAEVQIVEGIISAPSLKPPNPV